MKRTLTARIFLVLSFIMLALAGCASSGPEVKSISKAPGVSVVPDKLLVLAVSANETNRAVMEDALVARLTAAGYQATAYGPAPSLPWEDHTQLREKVKERLANHDANGVLTVSLVRKNRQVEHVPNQVVFNPVTVSMGPLASTTYMETINIPEQYQETTEYILRTTLFDAHTGGAIWQMFSSTVDPTSLSKAADEFSRVVVRELGKTFDQ